ncbi:30S ribosomal protein S9 [Candidatus Gottesmanbacteria bacterium RIFCSPHIGHO2_01_FULL_42_12]|uniref:Small ribosomal subunit protein uS9 n=1 Tax=Candidatus Gottesmanbacteria bacterium RIFCSPHIGHO2_01_FULL_42_12 TaxID=1798377 RepID=A0A1F5YZH9_9BACT|nr:MAG: 30S ribosomal protein S9 [Candidatus Gottesmanbacteria bacterium RIFCSPHIGHO2_01_FULL_42_12]
MTEVQKDYIFANGRRKRATARVRLFPVKDDLTIDGQTWSKGTIIVNGKPAEEYFKSLFYAKYKYLEVFRSTNTANKYVTTVVVVGSGLSGQLGAMNLGIARALVKIDPKNKLILRKKGYMTRDPREVERKKPGLPKARKHKSSPKR